MTDPIQVLMDEHRLIEKVLTALELADRREVPFAFYERAADFLANFADGCHHAKEEDRLFPLLEQRGIPREGGPIGVMTYEHEEGRGHIRRLRACAAESDRGGVRREAAAYAALLRAHIQKEDQVLFPMGRSRLTPEDAAAREGAFAEVEQQRDWGTVAEELLREAQG